MTDGQKEVWKQVQESYVAARAIALAVLPKDTPADVVQAATATILIQHDKAAGRASVAARTPTPTAAPKAAATPGGDVACPKCGGPTWDNRVGKRNPKAPDFKCKDKACDGAIWPPKNGAHPQARSLEQVPAPIANDDDDSGLPF